LSELGLADFKHESLAGPPEMDVAGELFEVRVKTKNDGKHWHIRSDAKVWSE
jgi:hypothetical protein